MQNIFLFISTLLAYFIKSITGFGNTLVMGSLFSFVVPNRLTTPVDLVLSIPTNIYIVWRERKNISLKTVVPLALMLLVGIVPGTFLLKVGNDWLLKCILGLVIVGIAIEMLLRKSDGSINRKANPVFLTTIGVLSGVMAGLYGIGALLVAYISRTSDNKNQFRANICCVFLIDNIFRFFLYSYTGILNKEILHTLILLCPAVLIGMFLGIKADSRMKEETVKKTVILLLIVSGTVLFVRSLFSFI
jgi:Predicted permeases